MLYKNHTINSLQSVNLSNNTAQMQLFGTIGQEVDGHAFANDLLQMARFGFDRIVININSLGGFVFEGFSIMNAMNALRLSGTKIGTYGLGVMDSMAGLVLAFGDRGDRRATTYSTGVIHEPSFENADTSIDMMPDNDLKKELVDLREVLITSLAISTGKSKEELAVIMKEGKRRTAQELLAIGVIDEVVEASNIAISQNLSRIETMAACTDIINNHNSEKMDKEVNKYEIKEKELLELVQNSTVKLAEKESEIQTLKAKNEELEAKLHASELTAVETYVDTLINEGRFFQEERESIVKQAVQNFEGFKIYCKAMKMPFVDVTKSIGTEGEDKMLECAKKYHNHDKSGTLEKYKNEVGDKKFQQIEDYYVENIEKIAK